jgi:fibro-slime domain-containing protein
MSEQQLDSRGIPGAARRPAAALAGALVLAAISGCAGVREGNGGGGGDTTGSGAGGSGSAVKTGSAGETGGGGDCGRMLHAVIRDFRGFPGPNGEPKHPDFEYNVISGPGIVASMLGADGKPVYAGGPPGATTNADNFNQWYRDVPGVNIHFEIDIPLTEDPTRPGTFVYDSDAFFPIDDMGWGNQYQSHNYDFTTEIHFNFPYRGGEVFNFRGDDDLFLFVNGHLAVDLGGVHVAESGSVNLDQKAADLGIAAGNSYRMDIFHAERHLSSSTFHVETTLGCIDNVIIP